MADQSTEGLLSPFLRDKRLNSARPFLRGKVLDVGCGSGKLARHVAPDRYLGIDIDAASIAVARASFPDHRFENTLFSDEKDFDTITALAVIEHVPSPAGFLSALAGSLSSERDAAIVCTTPHPSMEALYAMGTRIGLFSHSAEEEHEQLLDRDALDRSGRAAGLELRRYRRFLFGANQIAVFTRAVPR